jgi:hypothetical protein
MSCSLIFFEYRAVYEIMWKNIVGLDRPHMTIWLMRTACRMTEPTITHSEYVILTVFALGQWLQERVSALRLFVLYLSCSFITTLIRLRDII